MLVVNLRQKHSETTSKIMEYTSISLCHMLISKMAVLQRPVCLCAYITPLLPFTQLPYFHPFAPNSFELLRLVSVYTGPCRAHLDYSVVIVSTLPLHFLSVPSASNRSCQCQKCPVRDYGLGSGIWFLLLVSFGLDNYLEFDSLGYTRTIKPCTQELKDTLGWILELFEPLVPHNIHCPPHRSLSPSPHPVLTSFILCTSDFQSHTLVASWTILCTLSFGLGLPSNLSLTLSPFRGEVSRLPSSL